MGGSQKIKNIFSLGIMVLKNQISSQLTYLGLWVLFERNLPVL
jgi:hypothetical protein